MATEARWVTDVGTAGLLMATGNGLLAAICAMILAGVMMLTIGDDTIGVPLKDVLLGLVGITLGGVLAAEVGVAAVLTTVVGVAA